MSQVTSQQKFYSAASMVLLRLVSALAIVILCAVLAGAGGPKYVAGSTYFNSANMGEPITWQLGQISYYTDQGNLSPILSNSAANAFVADAFSQWTSVPTAALTATNIGQLSEDVNGGNIAANLNGAVTAPADITSSATQIPVGIVFDYDGSVTDALLGAGAGDPSQCFGNAVYGTVDNFGVGGNIQHALVVINGQCALQSSQLTDVEYRLVRVLGSVIGLGWSQLNVNVITGRPPPTSDDRAGFPVMHETDLPNCVPITVCFANPYQLSSDDVASLSRLYPAITVNSSARIHGTVYFADRMGNPGQPMQGANVFARWIDPSTGLPSHRYAISSVSGFLFTGNSGNPITGWSDPVGNPYSNYGSSGQSVEGFFDLGGLPIPNGASSAQYQLDVEALDPLWSPDVRPYDFFQVKPSGAAQPIVVTVAAGGDFAQDMLMSGSAQPVPLWAAAQTWSAPAVVPSPGDWIGSLSGYGDVGYFLILAQANRTLSVAVTALDETGAATESKAAPVIGIWTFGDPPGTPPPALTSTSFNSETFGMSRLDAQVLMSTSFIIGISDLRGDGRPDYHYHAHVLYGDSVTPSRIPANGSAITLKGIGLGPGLAVTIGSNAAPLLSTNAGQMLAAASAQNDGPQTITINDPASGAFSTMTNAVTFGAAATDQIILLPATHPPTPVGTQATNPVTVQVLAADGVTPVNGATVAWSTTNGATLSACGGISACSAASDQSGMASTWVTPAAAGTAVISAALAPAVYNPAKSISTVVSATSTTSSIGVTTPFLWIATGATLSVPLTARVVSFGSPTIGSTVNFAIMQGTASLSAPSAITNINGYASVALNLTNFSGAVLISACVMPGNNPCANISGNSVAPSSVNLQAVAGSAQVITGLSFQPMTVRVIDLSVPPIWVLGQAVIFHSTVMRPFDNGAEPVSSDPAATPSILSETETTVLSDVNGLATIVPSIGSFTGPLEIVIQVTAGSATLQGQMEILPSSIGGNTAQPTRLDWSGPSAPDETQWSSRLLRPAEARTENQ